VSLFGFFILSFFSVTFSLDYVVLVLFAFIVLDLRVVSSVLYAERLVEKNVAEMTYFVSSGV